MPERVSSSTSHLCSIWEYPRDSPDGEQMDLIEVMEIENGLIRRHRVYWGWYALKVQILKEG